MKIETKQNGDVAILILTGFFTMNLGENIIKNLISETLNSGVRKIIIEFKEVQFINSAGIGELVGAYIAVMNRGGQIKLCGLPDKVLKVLNITQLISIFEVYKTEEEAVVSFK